MGIKLVRVLKRSERPIEGRREMFNKVYSSLQSVIERIFGLWKKRWEYSSRNAAIQILQIMCDCGRYYGST